MEYMYFVTAKPRVSEDRKHLHFLGSLRSNHCGPVSLPEHDSVWQVTYGHRLIFSNGEVR